MSTCNFSVSLILDERSTKSDGSHPIKLRIIINRKSFHISMGYDVELKYWNKDREKLSTKYTIIGNVIRVNNFLTKEKTRIADKLLKLKEEGNLDQLSIVELKSILTDSSGEIMTLALFDSVIAELEKSLRYGNARVYNIARRNIKNFIHGQDIPLKQITYAWLKKYEVWYLSKGNSINGLSVNMRTLRSLYNRAIKQNKISSEFYPFKNYVIQHQETRKRYISNEDLNRIIRFKPQTERQKRAKDYFLISFYLMGASFVDIANLQMKNIISGRIEYRRQKTGKLHSIPISKPLKAILNKYMNAKNSDDYILHVIKSFEPKAILNDIREELIRYNKTLKEIGAFCKIEAPLTSYTSRHTYAMSGKRIGVPTAIISQTLGHKTEQTTQIYLDSFNNKTVDKYHDLIIKR